MDELFSSRKAKVLCVYKNVDGRSALSEAVRGAGFENVDGCDSVPEVLKRLEVEAFHWIILPLSKSTPVNAIHIMDLISRNSDYPGVKFSLLLEPDEVYVLPMAFELGLLSWHPITFNKAAIQKEIQALCKRVDDFKSELALVAADTLRELMIRDARVEDLQVFLRTLFAAYPKSHHVLAWLGEAEFAAGDRDAGRRAISTLKIWGSDLWKPLAEKYLDAKQELLPDIGVRNAVVVDPDDAVRKSVGDLLAKCGVTKVRDFADGLAAYEDISKDVPDLVIHEWKIPQLSGPSFIQRIRQDGHHQVPLLVFSSLVNKSDTILLQEMSVAHLIEKPFREDDVLQNLIWVMQQERFPTQQRSLERRMHQELIMGNVKKAKAHRSKLESDVSYAEGRRVYNEALFLFYAGDFENARNGFLKAIQGGAEYLAAVNMLGKCFLKLRNFRDAIACFEKAAALSPKNLERICSLAESHAELGSAEAAEKAVQVAESVDNGSNQVKRTAAKVEIQVGDVRKAAKMLASLGSLPTLIADMNNSAVALIRTKDFSGGMTLYEKTIEALPPKETGLRIRVLYNMALACVRMNDVEKADEILKSIPESFVSPVMGKVRKLQKKVTSALFQSRDVVLDSVDGETTMTDSEDDFGDELSIAETEQNQGGAKKTPAGGEGKNERAGEQKPAVLTLDQAMKRMQSHVMSGKPGERCCHSLFYCPENLHPQARELLANPPRFRKREAIQRPEGMGVERNMK